VKIGVMQGSLREFDLAAVLQVVGLGRQYTGIEVSLGGGRSGTIFVKSGQVVSATAEDSRGADAFRNLFRAADGSFFVFRLDTPAELPEPLGPLDSLLMEAVAERSSLRNERPSYAPQEQVTQTGVAPPPAGAPAPMPAPSPRPSSRPPARSSRPPAPLFAAPAVFGSRPPVVTAVAADARILAFASPKGGSGKSTIALNTSLSLARRGHSVVLVDADVNGDVLSAIDARERAKCGTLDVVAGTARLEDALLETVLPKLKIVPAVGPRLPDLDAVARDVNAGFAQLFGNLARRADVVVVDTPAGMFGMTSAILRAVTHVVGVLQAEVLAARSFQRFFEGLALLPEPRRPNVIGVVLNMLQTRHGASLGVFQDALADLPGSWLFDTTIPRHPAFLDASKEGVPLRQLDEDAPPPVAFLFDNLAGEIAERLALRRPAQKKKRLLA
jgi:chromosome partitioning protein